MTEGWKIALIGSLAAIIGSLGLPKLYCSLSDGYMAWISKKSGNIKFLRKRVKEQDDQIEQLKNQLNEMTIRMEIIIPLLRRQLKDDKEAMELLKHFDLKNANITPAGT